MLSTTFLYHPSYFSMHTKQTILDKAIAKARQFVEEKEGENTLQNDCVRVSIYVHRPQPPKAPLGINYIITFQKDEDGKWQYKNHDSHIPSVDYAKLVNVDPILHYCK